MRNVSECLYWLVKCAINLEPIIYELYFSVWATVCKTFRLCYKTVVHAVLSVTLVDCRQTVRWIKMKLGTEVGLGPATLYSMRTQLPSPKGAQPPFSAHVCCLAKWLDGSRSHLIRRSASAQATLC